MSICKDSINVSVCKDSTSAHTGNHVKQVDTVLKDRCDPCADSPGKR
jgi:hypothetical protein